jgi:hypothetical protein
MTDPKDKKGTEGEKAKDPKEYYHGYYVTNRETLSEKRRKKYASDPSYHAQVKRRAMNRYKELREQKLKERERLQTEIGMLNREAGKLLREINDIKLNTPASTRLPKLEEQHRNLVAAIEVKNRELGPGVRGYNRPRVMAVDGQDSLVHCVSEFADRVGRDVQTITAWEQNKIIPMPTVTDEMGRRWYNEGHMNFVAGLVERFRSAGGRNLDEFKGLVWKEWKKVGKSDGVRVS